MTKHQKALVAVFLASTVLRDDGHKWFSVKELLSRCVEESEADNAAKHLTSMADMGWARTGTRVTENGTLPIFALTRDGILASKLYIE